jgi:deoxyribonuclease V
VVERQAAALEGLQRQLAASADEPAPWRPVRSPGLRAGGVFAAPFHGLAGAGAAGDPAWAAAVVIEAGEVVDEAVLAGTFAAPYVPGYLALRQLPLLERAVRALSAAPDVLLVDATGRDHPRRAGLALHLGAMLDLPTIGVTDRPLTAIAGVPGPRRGDRAELRVGGELVGFSLRTRERVRPVCVSAGWRTDPDTAAALALALCAGERTPAPLRAARQRAREARSRAAGTAAGCPPPTPR